MTDSKNTGEIRHNWNSQEIREIHDLPITELVHKAQTIHRMHHEANQVQLCTLLSIKTGACSEDCSYCPQSGRYDTSVKPERLMSVESVLAEAKQAKQAGASRFCMGASWRDAKSGKDFGDVLEMVRGVRALGMEACATLGMLDEIQAAQLSEAGLTAYNHNLDTSREFYDSVITTRSYDERLETLGRVADAGISVCCGGIIGMGESIDDRCKLLMTLSHMTPHPGSVPVNALVAVKGTPLEDQPPVDSMELVRMCATARILMPKAMVRLSAGRERLSKEAQILCFLAGANSIFYGDKLLTTPNPEKQSDKEMLREAGLKPLPSVHASA